MGVATHTFFEALATTIDTEPPDGLETFAAFASTVDDFFTLASDLPLLVLMS